MKITENKKGRCTGCCAAALSAGLDGTYDFLLVAPVFLHPAEKDAKNHLTNCYGGGYYIGKAGSAKKVMGACQKKIVRLILMSNISRRKFLKGAGVAALAVAAAGVLAGCSKDDVPVIPEVTAKDVTVKFVDRNGKEVDSIIVRDVKLTETKMNSNDVKAPEGYVIGIVGDQPIDWKKQTVTFTVDKKDTKKVQVQYYNREGDGEVGTEIVEVEKDAIGVSTSLLKKIPAGYKLDTVGDITINYGIATVYVSRK